MTEFNTRLVLEAERTVCELRGLWVGGGDRPPLELAEALEDAANLLLELSEEISAAHQRRFAAERACRAAGTQPPAA